MTNEATTTETVTTDQATAAAPFLLLLATHFCTSGLS
jgi:hypothetical protein